jgi:hypothetical protein
LYGGKGIDTLIGGTGSDKLYGGDGDDNLIGNDGYGSPDLEADELFGGKDFDTYMAGNSDTIQDDLEGKGVVHFTNADGTDTILKKGIATDNAGEYEGDGGIYTLSGTTLTFEKGGEKVTIKLSVIPNSIWNPLHQKAA